MNRQEKIILVVALLLVSGVVTVSFGGGPRATAGKARSSLKAGLADTTSGTTARVASPWDATVDQHVHNSWTCPPWSMAMVGAIPLRLNHPLHRHPPYPGHNRHKVMCDGWNGWFYDAPANEVL